jgi:hypothetical protein
MTIIEIALKDVADAVVPDGVRGAIQARLGDAQVAQSPLHGPVRVAFAKGTTKEDALDLNQA